MFQGCFKGVLRVFQGRYGSFMSVSRLFQGCLKHIESLSIKYLLLLLLSSQLPEQKEGLLLTLLIYVT